MSITLTKKLTISSRIGFLSLIDEGNFLRIYNQSAYIINKIFQQNLKIATNILNKSQKCSIVYCGFPKRNLSLHFNNAQKMEWGYQIAGDFDLSGYQMWFNQFFTLSKKDINTRVNPLVHHQSKIINQSQQPEIMPKLSPKTVRTTLHLNTNQLIFLKNWQPDSDNNKITQQFMLSLQRQLFRS